MRKVILYIAMSLDGYIADQDGKVDFLYGNDPSNTSGDYDEFIKQIDTVIMGNTTYKQVRYELAPDHYMYEGLTSYIITRSNLTSDEKDIIYHNDPVELVKRLKNEPGKNIFLIGGAEVIEPLLNENLIDLFQIYIIPTILGNGVKLFKESDTEKRLQHLRSWTYNGIVRLVYIRK